MSHLIRDLDQLHRSLLNMSTKVEELIHQAVQELFQHTPFKAPEFSSRDDEIDTIDVQIEEECLKLLALHQPVATDLRRITTVMKISAELERVADLAIHIAERATSLRSYPRIQIPDQFSTMSEIAISMLHHSIDAYVDLDTELARKVCREDDTVDKLNREIIELLISRMKASPESIEALMLLFSATRHIERVADHATNISEDIVYLVKGDIIRHRRQPLRDTQRPAM